MSVFPHMHLAPMDSQDKEADTRDDGQWPDLRYDGHLHRDSDGVRFINLRHDPRKKPYHLWLLSLIADADRRGQ
jgi:hypothetical protein